MKTNHLIKRIFVILMTCNSLVYNIEICAQETMYLHTDYSIYLLEDTIWFKCYDINVSTHMFSSRSSFLNVTLYNDKGIEILSQRHKLIGGKTDGYIALNAKSLAQGKYILTAYSNLENKLTLDEIYYKVIEIKGYQDAEILVSLFDTIYEAGKKIEGNIEVKDGKGNKYKDVEILIELCQKGLVLESKTIVIDGEKNNSFDFNVPESISADLLYIQAKIVNSLVKIETFLPVYTKEFPPSIQFFPEGGSALANNDNIIAYRATDKNGNPFDFSAQIFDERDHPVKPFKSQYLGMGKISLNYRDSSKFYCKIVEPSGYNEKYFLPVAKKESYSINITNNFKNQIIIKINTNKSLKDSVLRLVLSMNNSICLDQQLNLYEDNKVVVNTDGLSMGILKVNICDNEKKVLTERLVFITRKGKTPIKISGLKEEYDANETVDFNIESLLNNELAEFSVSVCRINSGSRPYEEDNILSSLLLKKVLKEDIPTPGFYFSEHLAANYATDLIMLTNDLKEERTNFETNSEEIEKLMIPLQGIVLKNNGKPVNSAEVTLLNYKTFSTAKTRTNGEGYFNFSLTDYLMVVDTNSCAVVALGPNNNKKVKPLLKNPQRDKISSEIQKMNLQSPLKFYYDYLNSSFFKEKEEPVQSNQLYLDNNSPSNTILVEETDIVEKRISPLQWEKHEKKYKTYEVSEGDIKYNQTFDEMLRKAAGSFIYANGGVLFRGNNSILKENQQPAAIVVDGVFKGFALSDLGVDPREIESIKVTKTAAAGLRYTAYASGGLIEVKTKNWNTVSKSLVQNEKPENIINIPAFMGKKEFQEKSNEASSTLNGRNTAYWNSSIKVGPLEKRNIQFSVPGVGGEYVVKVEGVSQKGNLIYLEKKFMVN